jgi:hypothetical protein
MVLFEGAQPESDERPGRRPNHQVSNFRVRVGMDGKRVPENRREEASSRLRRALEKEFGGGKLGSHRNQQMPNIAQSETKRGVTGRSP